MQSLRLLVSGITAALVLLQWVPHALAAPLDDLIAAAAKEGTLNFYGPSSLKADGAQAFAQAFNKKYNSNINVIFIPSGSMTRDVGKVATQAATGAPPEWDVMVATDAHHASLWLRKLHKPFNYRSLGVDEKLIDHDSSAISFVHQYIVPAYNNKLVSPQDTPKSWEDLLNPRWKGKLGVTTATHHLGRLATGPWGEEKTTAYVKAMAKQDPVVGQLGPTYTRLQLGEILVAFTLTDSYIHLAKETGAPVAAAEEVQPVIAPSYHVGVLKGARHPNAAHLFAVFMTTPEAQKLWEKEGGVSSSLIPGTAYYQKAKGKQMIYMSKEHAEKVEQLAKKFGKMLGIR
ncbi:MAG TPA: extracellular solute-binding protein [Candidatus Binatia bacterium]|jgi:iron(III) transport system substrate-binding protein